MSLPPEVEASYATIIDSILAASDINTISAKQIRKGLQQAVDYDLEPQKDLIKALIIARFDKFNNAAAPAQGTKTNGEVNRVKALPHKPRNDERFASVPKDEDQPKKKRKLENDDAKLAAKLQALENTKARPTRGGGSKKAAPVKRKPPKSKSRLKAEDDSEVDSEVGEERKRKVNRNGGFHKPFTLSTALSNLLGGETSLSRPEVVKRIWAYVKERDLQNPNDKRFIECDDPLRTVFKQDKVHMFTMNKLLNQHLYAQDEL